MATPCSHCGSTTDQHDRTCPNAQLALIGQVLDGRYRIEDVIGQGGMGLVFRAVQTSVQRPVAVKTLNPALAAAPQFFERFKREAEVASRLRHPNVITIYDFGRTQDGTCYYVMELLEGESLRELVKREGPLSIRRAVYLVEQATRGLAHAHEQGAVHRDIKPHNIMLQQLGNQDIIKVLDFGLVKALEQEDDMQLTSTGQVLGTPQYMPPEQAGGEGVDHRSDLYSMAGVLYYCLTGTSPYGANTVRKALTAALTQPVPAIASKRQGAPVPKALEEFMQKGLAREKEDRFQGCEEFIDAMLEAVSRASPEVLDARPTGVDPREVSTPSKARGSGSSSQSGARKPGSAPGRGSQPSNIVVSRSVAEKAPSRPAPPGSARPTTTMPATLPEPSSGKGLKIALVVVPLLLLGGVGAVVALRSPEKPANPAPATPSNPTPAATTPPKPAPQPAPPQPAANLRVTFTSEPEGVGIYDGDLQIGTTPTELMLSRDKVHNLMFRKAGYVDAEKTYDLSRLAADTQTVSVKLEPVKPADTGSRPTRPTRPTRPKDDDITVFE